VDSVYRQTYRPIECIIVDDASTDDTGTVIDLIQASYPAAIIIRHNTNGGQGAACRTGFDASRGQYVVFMDADDVLHPDFVLTHAYVHLSSRVPAGLSSSDIFQSVDGQLVVCTGQAMNDYIMAHPQTGASLFRPVPRAPKGPWTFDQPGEDVLTGAVHVPAGYTHWCWSPGTANMYRRDAVSMFARSDELAAMRHGADAFLCVAAASLCGGVLIDRPLSTYRIHGGNTGSYQAQLTNVRAVRAESEPSKQALVCLLDFYTRNAGDVIPRLWSSETYIKLLEAIDATIGGWGEHGTLAERIAEHESALSRALGPARLATWMRRRRRKSFLRRYRWLRTRK
jgi:glycosyltransferase involved in cell wall biosynthesis